MLQCNLNFNVKTIKWIFVSLFFVSTIIYLGSTVYTRNRLWMLSFYNYSASKDKNDENIPKFYKTILYWNAFYGHPWTSHFGPDNPEGLKDIGCSTFQCRITSDKHLVNVADAIIFNTNIYSVQEWLSQQRSSPEQVWIWLEAETPFAVVARFTEHLIADASFSRNFNWTMTYHSSADLRYHYGYFLPTGGTNKHHVGLSLWETTPRSHMEKYSEYLNTNSSIKGLLIEETYSHRDMKFSKNQFITLINEEIANKNHGNKNKSDNSTAKEDGSQKPTIITWDSFVDRPKLVAWMSGHCKTLSNREEYVFELQKYIPVDLFGSCGNLTCFERHPVSIQCWRETLRPNYLFFLAMENTLCDEYITEKVYNPLMHGLVPIVWGGANYSRFLPPHSFIDARKYHPKNLAKLLLKLQANREDYKRYQFWRKFWTVHYGQTFCELCHKLHNVQSYKKTKLDETNHQNYGRLQDWRLQNENCVEEVQRDLFKGEKWKIYINDDSYR